MKRRRRRSIKSLSKSSLRRDILPKLWLYLKRKRTFVCWSFPISVPAAKRALRHEKGLWRPARPGLQTRPFINDEEVKAVTKRAPTKAEMKALLFNWKVVKYTKSNAIVIGKEDRTTGIGMGQTNRIWAARQAIEHAGAEARGTDHGPRCVFPLPDCVEECVKAGITAIIQPGGSIRDQLSIDACDEAGIAMIFVGQRHFRH